MIHIRERIATGTINSLIDKFIYELAAIYDAEQRFLAAQQQIIHHVSDTDLKSMLHIHIRETAQQIRNLEQVFGSLGQNPVRVNCETSAAFVADTEKLINATAINPNILNVVIAATQLKVEYYEITCYRSLLLEAELLRQIEVVNLLKQNLQQEEQTAQKIENNVKQLLEIAILAEVR